MKSMRSALILTAAAALAAGPVSAATLGCPDGDGDGYIDGSCGGPDCDDTNSAIFPGALEACDSIDSDCDGLDDANDGDAGATTVMYENLEASDGGWGPTSPSGVGLWEWGAPTSGPFGAYSGSNVWGTVLGGNYGAPDNTSYLDTSPFLVPVGTPTVLKFAYWQQNDMDCQGDASVIDIVDAVGNIVPVDNDDSCLGGLADTTGWVETSVDLTAFAGVEVWVRFIQITDGADNSSPGTYLDDVRVVTTTDTDGDGWSVCGDCDDTDAAVSPDALEICSDGIDNDCEGTDAVADFDGDSFINLFCDGDDCDDLEAAVFPGATEICDDGLDNDCDDGDLIGDADLDGFDGAQCGGPDCNDDAATTFPGAPELCNNAEDDDCDIATPDIVDADLDGFSCDSDCNDEDASINPDAIDLPCNGADDDCDPATSIDPDEDGDGASCGLDCDDDDPTRSPDFLEVCDDGIDNDCNPSTADVADLDFDGFGCLDDCDDADPAAFPGAPEICGDGLDQDCDGDIDELVNDNYALDDDGSVTVSLCSFSFPLCGADWTQVVVQANGRVTFGFDDDGSSGLGFFFVQQTPEIAALWSDLDPSSGGDVIVTEDDGFSLSVAWLNVPSAGAAGTASTMELLLFPDGTASIEYGALDQTWGLVGFACSADDVVETDLSDPGLPDAAWAIGQGTESAVYEAFSQESNPVDLADGYIDLCLTGGTDADLDGWTDLCGDCDDDDTFLHPSAIETCDGADEDCDGDIDDRDFDGDGYIDSDCGGDDCDDDDPTVFPNAEELCNGLDDNCDGETEPLDGDLDGYGGCDDDCDDTDSSIYPGADETCNSRDDDCDGEIDEGFVNDADLDGEASTDCGGPDCNDDDATVLSTAEEVCDSIDNNCDDVIDDVDADLDGWIAEACGGDDCDDNDPLVSPDVVEEPYDGIDNDCDGIATDDADGDGFTAIEVSGQDCDDSNDTVFPTAQEICDDAIDNDCDAAVDDDDDECAGCSGCSTTAQAAPASALLSLLLLLPALRRRRRCAPAC